MIKQYTITLDNYLPTSKPLSFSDEVEEGVIVLKTEDDLFYITHSNFIAKTLREFTFCSSAIFNSDFRVCISASLVRFCSIN